jgi:hypothetical protein
MAKNKLAVDVMGLADLGVALPALANVIDAENSILRENCPQLLKQELLDHPVKVMLLLFIIHIRDEEFHTHLPA